MKAPAVEKMMNVEIRIRATPAGKLMKVRTIGSSRPMNTVAAPCRAKNESASSISCGRMSRYLP